MSSKEVEPYYTGNPKIPLEPNKWEKLPYNDPDDANDPALYVAEPGLRDAVNVALELGLPLLLTGEPGVGKSSVARSVNREMGFPPEDLLHFTVKSDTRDSELFYNYDTLGRFHAVHGQVNVNDPAAKRQADAEADPRRFIRYQALGMAILRAKGRGGIPAEIMTEAALIGFPERRRRSVVLIDEIDKAPRDMPNDILNEIERMEFRIPELFLDQPIKLESEQDKRHRPIVIITSNGERDLPEAFLRRCLFYHMTMPKFKADIGNNRPEEVSVEAIVASRLGEDFFTNRQDGLLRDALSLFRYLRSDAIGVKLRRKPSLAEFLDWLRYLGKRRDGAPLLTRNDFQISIKASLLKNPDDQNQLAGILDAWRKQP